VCGHNADVDGEFTALAVTRSYRRAVHFLTTVNAR